MRLSSDSCGLMSMADLGKETNIYKVTVDKVTQTIFITGRKPKSGTTFLLLAVTHLFDTTIWQLFHRKSTPFSQRFLSV